MKKISKVETWDSVQSVISPEQYRSMLTLAFLPAELIFNSIYMPVKYVRSTGIDEDWSYVDIGLSANSMSSIYNTQYGANYLIDYIDDDMSTIEKQEVMAKLRTRISNILDKNKGKYLKLIELQGYTYNPLWNVDGTEVTTTEYGQHITDTDVGQRTKTDNIAQVQNTDAYGIHKITDVLGNKTDTTNEYSTTMDDVANTKLKNRTEDIIGLKTDTHTTDAKSDTHTFGAHLDTHTDAAAKDTVTSKAHTDTVTYERHGNIGTTKTQELIEAERNNLRFNIIQEFFNDINEYILVGIY